MAGPTPAISYVGSTADWCLARGSTLLDSSPEWVNHTAYLETKLPPTPPPPPPPPPNEWVPNRRCTTQASHEDGNPQCNGWDMSNGDQNPKRCVAKCTANALPAGCSVPAGGFKCDYAEWSDDSSSCQVGGVACGPVVDPDHHVSGPGGGYTQHGHTLWRLSDCDLKPGFPRAFAPVCQSMSNRTACVTVNATCAWNPTLAGVPRVV